MRDDKKLSGDGLANHCQYETQNLRRWQHLTFLLQCQRLRNQEKFARNLSCCGRLLPSNRDLEFAQQEVEKLQMQVGWIHHLSVSLSGFQSPQAFQVSIVNTDSY